MKILTLIIKQVHFDAILSGEKKQEFREIRPTTMNKYCQVDNEGFVVEKDGIVQTIKYDAIRFYVGYNKDRATALVAVKNANVEVFIDENDEIITFDHEGETFTAAQIVYDLGKVLEK